MLVVYVVARFGCDFTATPTAEPTIYIKPPIE